MRTRLERMKSKAEARQNDRGAEKPRKPLLIWRSYETSFLHREVASPGLRSRQPQPQAPDSLRQRAEDEPARRSKIRRTVAGGGGTESVLKLVDSRLRGNDSRKYRG
jgi:hypothetical protein